MNRFPLLRLPYVALREVIESTDKSDVLNLAMVSGKIYKLIETTKNVVSLKKLSQDDIDGLGVQDRLKVARLETLHNSKNVRKELEVNLSNKLFLTIKTFYSEADTKKSMIIQVHIEFNEDRGNHKVFIPFGNLNVPVIIDSNDTIHTLWNDADFGLRYLIHHFFQKFGLKRFSSLDINPESTEQEDFSKILRSTIDILRETFPAEGPNVQIMKFGLVTDEDSQYVFDGVEYKDIIIMGRRTSGNFSCQGNLLLLGDADWFSLEDLLNAKCELVILRGTTMTSELMKEVLMHWMDKTIEKLAHLSVELREDMDIEEGCLAELVTS